MVVVDIVPVPKPRMTQRDKWTKRPETTRYWKYCKDLRTDLKPFEVVDHLSIIFYLPMPPSWTNKKRAEMLGQAHKQKPDLDNLIKAFKDALMKDDSVISSYGPMTKLWGETGKITILEGLKRKE